MRLVERVHPSSQATWWQGLCWHETSKCPGMIVVAVIPLNVILRMGWHVCWWFRRPFLGEWLQRRDAERDIRIKKPIYDELLRVIASEHAAKTRVLELEIQIELLTQKPS